MGLFSNPWCSSAGKTWGSSRGGRIGETLTLKQIYEEIANNDILDIRVPVERKGKDLVVTPEILAMFKPDVDGRLHPIVDTSGQITEASAAAIAADIATMQVALNGQIGPSFGSTGGTASTTAVKNLQHRLAVVPVVTDGAGDSAAVVLVGNVSGYTFKCRILYVYATGTDGAWDAAFTCSVGAQTGIPNLTGLATTVNVIGPDWTPGGLVADGDTDNSDFSVQIANGGNVIEYFFVLEYWYET